MDQRNHAPCAYENKHFGAWEVRENKDFPWGWFFKYYELKAVDSVTGELVGRYFQREAKIDFIFHNLCLFLEKIKRKIEKYKNKKYDN